MELWDLVDKNRKPLNKTIEKGAKLNAGEYRQVVHVAIFNSEGKLLIQQRQDFRKLYPGLWDISVGGSVISGEDTIAAGEREVEEELGVSVSLQNERPYFTINFDGGFDDFYIIQKDLNIDDLLLQAEEVKDCKWASKDEALAMRDKGLFIPYHDSFLPFLFEIAQKRGLHK